MWPGLPQLKQRPLRGSLFDGLVRSRSIGWGPEGAEAGEGLEEEEEEALAAEGAMEEGRNEDSLVDATFGWVSRNRLHWLSSKEVLRFHSAQVDGMGSSR